MSEPRCSTGCSRPTYNNQRLCSQCAWELEQALAEMPALLDELDTTLTRQAKMSDASDGGRAAEKPLPFHVTASEVLIDLRVYLVGWVKDLANDDPARYPTDDLVAMSTWLLARLGDITLHDAADDIHEEIVTTSRQAWRVVDRAANRTRFAVGPCPELTPEDGVQCAGEVWAYIPTSEERPARLECSSCGARWETHQWLRVGKRIIATIDSSTVRQRQSLSV